jgi:hypothetical protein
MTDLLSETNRDTSYTVVGGASPFPAANAIPGIRPGGVEVSPAADCQGDCEWCRMPETD